MPCTPTTNVICKRKSRNIISLVHCLLVHHLSLSFTEMQLSASFLVFYVDSLLRLHRNLLLLLKLTWWLSLASLTSVCVQLFSTLLGSLCLAQSWGQTKSPTLLRLATALKPLGTHAIISWSGLAASQRIRQRYWVTLGTINLGTISGRKYISLDPRQDTHGQHVRYQRVCAS